MNITKIISKTFDSRLKQIDLYASQASEIQHRVLSRLTRQAAQTEWGRKYDYSSIRNYEDFRKRVPIQTYEEIKPYVERLRAGEQNLLWPSEIRWFAKSSGTTNDKSKFLPVSKEALEDIHYRGGKDAAALYFRINPDSHFFSGKGLILGGSHSPNLNSNHSLVGDLSAILIQNVNPLINFIRVPSKKIALMSEWETKIEAIANSTIPVNVTSLSGVPSWMLVLIKRILEKTGKQALEEVWPNLEVFFHGGVAFTPYREQYKQVITTPKMHYVETYNASEGYFGTQNDLSDPAMLLMIDYGIFYEFVPLEEVGKENPRAYCLEEANTYFAQGGVASVTNLLVDNFDKHIEDTMIAGDWISNRAAVEKVVREAPAQIEELIKWGVDFDKNEKGEFDLHREGGHSEFRILHHKDNTGAEIQDSLIKAVQRHPNITVIENQFAIEILTQHHLGVTVTRQTPDIKCYGAYILDPKTGKVDTYLAKVTLMATGGVGAVYKTTTNPLVATGDGIAMVYRAKGTVKDMEFVQFHPTALYHPGDRPSFLITEAMRGYGGVLRTMDGKEFMQKYDPRLSLAPRDIVARAIDNEMKNRGDDHVYLDVTHKDPEETKKHFPNIYEKCLSLGIDITKDYIPVAPAAHYLCGGILVDLDGQSSIERLYAVGECSCTGLHGGNRLASNSLIEAVVYADAAAKHSLQVVDQYSYNENIPEWNDEGTRSPEEMVLITQSMKEVNQIMSTYVGIVRSDLRLKRAWDRLDIIYEETESLFKRSVASREICELRNMVNVGYLIMRQAMERKESRGLHYTIDYPHVKK